MNKNIGRVCPEVYAVDGTREYFEKPFCVMEYIEGAPLNLCYGSFDNRTRSKISYQIGELAAKINFIGLDENHKYISERGPWNIYMAERLRERLTPLVENELISRGEINEIAEYMRANAPENANSFLHLDIRRVNIIYNGGEIFLLDAENCEFGDPLCELAVINVGGELDRNVIEGYKSVGGRAPEVESKLYRCYFIERVALVADVFINVIKTDARAAETYSRRFNDAKRKFFEGTVLNES